MNVLFVNHNDFRSNSAVHIANLANHLEELGVSCGVAVPRDARRSARGLGQHRFHRLDYKRVGRGMFDFADGEPPNVIHAWTPREGVRKLTTELAHRLSVPHIVHLEDNEDIVAADQLGVPRDRLLSMTDADIEDRLTETISHPRRSRAFIAAARGATMITEPLAKFVPADLPRLVIRPAFERDLFRPQPASERLRRRLGLRTGEKVVVYAGNVHPTNAEEVRNLYLAVADVSRRGTPIRLVRLGQDFEDFLAADTGLRRRIEIRVAFQPRDRLPAFYALADVLVQPGRPDLFNDYRIPSKLPEFFAMGLPVILPRTNLGLTARDGEECLLLGTGDAEDIASKIERVLDDDGLRERLGLGARSFAERTFSWARGARELEAFYRCILADA
jgi:glycosyltransferase involved in cell wall biosynthesis